MFRFKQAVGLAAVAAVIAAFGVTSAVSAQTVTPPATTPPTTQTAPRDGFGPRELHSEAALAAAAKALGMTADELSAELWGGKTLSAIAEEQGVDIADVQAAVEAAQVAETKTAIEQAVTDGTLTQDKADWLLEGLNAGFWGPGVRGDFGGAMGFGMGPDGGHGGPRGMGGPMGALPSGTAPSNSTTPSATN